MRVAEIHAALTGETVVTERIQADRTTHHGEPVMRTITWSPLAVNLLKMALDVERESCAKAAEHAMRACMSVPEAPCTCDVDVPRAIRARKEGT